MVFEIFILFFIDDLIFIEFLKKSRMVFYKVLVCVVKRSVVYSESLVIKSNWH